MKKKYFKNILFFLFIVFGASTLSAQNEKEINKIKSRYNLEKLQTLKNSFKQKASSDKQNAIQIAQQRGWKTKFTTNDGRMLELQRVVNGKPIYYTTFNVDAAKSTRTDHLNSGGSLGLNLMGQNMTAHVWDGGLARTSHQEYDGAGGTNRFSIGDGTTALHYHSAHVTGTIMASGVNANAKGMAPHANAVGYDWNSDKAEATSAAANGMLVSNHSYGYAARNQFGQVQLPQHYFGGYIDETRDWDEILFNAPNYLMVVAAGNDGNDNTANNNPIGGSGFDKLTGHSTAKNNLVVANANDANIDANGNLVSVTINSSSSEGPTDDFRIKPDITGNGTGVYSTYESSNTAYNSITGTSMASPNVAGSVLLLQQHANNIRGSFAKASTIKGVVLHTADDAGASGPDAVFGWGLMNTKRAAEAISENGNESKVEELTLTSGQTYTITVDSDGVNPLLASISWTDRAGPSNTTVNSTTPVLVNDLDIRVTKGGTTHFPYKLTGATTNAKQDNNVDPYERVDIAGATGTYTITVTHKGSLTGGSQNYSLVVTGLTGTPVVCNATVPTGVNATNVSATGATISWNAVPAASYDVRYRVAGTTSWATNAVNGASTVLSGLSATTSYEVQVRSKCDSGNSVYSSSVNFTTSEVQLNYCASNGNSVADEYISNVNIGSIDNTTGASSSGYADYSSISTNLTKGAISTITITPTWTGTLYNEGYGVFIDFNKDGDFSDSGETVWTRTASQTTPVSGSFSVPTSAITGATRMRVVMRYNAVPSACGSYNYGETEDYTVNLVGGTPDTTAPVITLNGTSTMDIDQGSSFTDPGATASDNIDGNLTSSIVVTGTVNSSVVGTYTLNYNVSDAAGNPAIQVSRTVNVNAVADTTVPIITLNGSSTMNLTLGDSFTDPGATATDNVDGNLTSSIVVTGTVNTASAGTYTLNYNVSDAAGNAATQVTRTVNVDEPAGDTEAPTAPTNLVASNITETTATLSWNASSDNVGVTAYEVFSNGTSIGTVTSTGANITGLTANTAYSYTVRALDAAGNVSSTSNTETFTTPGGSTGSTTVLHEGFFESGWDGWSDGGVDCKRYSGSRSFEGTKSIRLRDNSGVASAMTSQPFNLTSYDQVEVNFYFYSYSMENNEDFWLRFYNGSSWATVGVWARGTSFQNNNYYSATVTLNSTDVNFASNSAFRFQNDASGNADHIYIDQVTITGIVGNGGNTANSINMVAGYSNFSDTGSSDFEGDTMLYPNPAIDIININPNFGAIQSKYRITNLLGQVITSGSIRNNSINVSTLKRGIYLLELTDDEETFTTKFVKK
ncbi:immunoglobulin-like domain-containing protein [Tenacibaculum todarodis]|uniref:immunoglobulin-like domain-containing protein n=1 Tax=Tenacibaculum todarodis TaxID=1850252 RepID=UPI0009F564E8|nr:immunoglobulin-like domain-containing protein [Tenacibaculum todarodis]